MDVGNRLMDSRERWTFLLLAGACVGTVKKAGWILVSMWLFRGEYGASDALCGHSSHCGKPSCISMVREKGASGR